jgi:hypothetical protein
MDCARRFYLSLQVSRNSERRDWGKWVHVYMDWLGPDEGFVLVGIERQE